MSYDCTLCDPKTGKTVRFSTPHHLRGGTYALGGNNHAWLNITYNYSQIYYGIWPERGLNTIEGLTAMESFGVLTNGIASIPYEPPDDNYWLPTNGNARAALSDLLTLATLAPPDSVWQLT